MQQMAIVLALASAVVTGCASKPADRNAGEELEVRGSGTRVTH
ncbi:MAG TPA: hypothetical protein VGO84_15835 [Burkholderiales bacterium]|nr:hypothetical protein [Burkholderiales bacterium]